MLDLMAIVLTIVLAAGFTYVTKYNQKNVPETTDGPTDHDPMPEVRYVYPLEARDKGAQQFAGPGGSYQAGSFGLRGF